MPLSLFVLTLTSCAQYADPTPRTFRPLLQLYTQAQLLFEFSEKSPTKAAKEQVGPALVL